VNNTEVTMTDEVIEDGIGNEVGEEEVVEPVGPKYGLVTDAWPNLVKLSGEDQGWKCDGAPNWRRLPGFPIYATGQPDKKNISDCVDQAVKKYDEQKNALWVNLRQEPVLYVNGKPYSVRATDDLANHLVLDEAFEMNNLENKVASAIKKEDKFMFAKDQVGERLHEKVPEYKLETGRPDNISTLSDTMAAEAKKQSKLEVMRIPLSLNSAPSDASFDMLVKLLKSHNSAVPVIFSCQGGVGRSSTASVIAALVKEAQLEAEFAKMKGIVPDNILDNLRDKKLHPPMAERDPNANALMVGDFPVVKDLLSAVPEAKEAKDQVDRLIDLVGPPSGVENIREVVVMDKMQFDVASDEWREVLRDRIMDQIEKYFMLIAFALYCKEEGPTGFNKNFSSWLENKDLKEQIETGKSKLEWERKIPDEQIQDLKELLKVDNFDDNLPAVINKINQLSYKMFSDLPRGDQKCKSMRKIAGRTLIEVLPPKLCTYLETKLGELSKVPDFYEMVGLLSFYNKIPVLE